MAFFSDIPALFYSGPVDAGETVLLDPEEARHFRALRLHPEDRIQLLDGRGRRSTGEVERVEKGRIEVRVCDTVLEEPEKGVYIGLAVGLIADKSRMEWVVEKGVEFGVGALYPIRSERAEGFFNAERMRRVAVAALKQSQRSWLPELHGPTGWKDLAAIAAAYDMIFLCHEQGANREAFGDVVQDIPDQCRVLILVGPEGGFSDTEVADVRERLSGRILSLGEGRLRSETAAIGVLAALRIMKQ